MQIFSAIIQKQKTLPHPKYTEAQLKTILDQICRQCFPSLNHEKETTAQSWTSPGRGTHIHLLSNEPNHSVISKNEHHQIIVIGQVSGNISRMLAGNTVELHRSSGQFLLIKVSENEVTLITDMAGTFPFYICEISTHFIISTRARVAHELALKINPSTQSIGFDFDILACRSFALQGHYFGRRCGFRETECSSVHEQTSIRHGSLSRTSWYSKDEGASAAISLTYDAFIDELCAALLSAFQFFNGSSVNLSITGGRDSRILAAALRNIPSIQVRTSTAGTSELPDVIIGKLISHILGWPHQSRPPNVQKNQILIEHPTSHVYRTLDIHDCMTSAWDACPDYKIYTSLQSLSGVGGEVLRGGMTLISKENLTTHEAQTIIKNTMCGGSFFTDEISTQAKEQAKSFLDKCEHDAFGALDDYYRLNRNHRWINSRRNGVRVIQSASDPLLDNRVMVSALSIEARTRWSERMAFDVIARLAPQLRDLPLDGERWRFERNGSIARPGTIENNMWNFRTRLIPGSKRHTGNWRYLHDKTLRAIIIKSIIDNIEDTPKSTQLFKIDALREYLTHTKYATTIWHILTCVVFMSGKWRYWSREKENPTLTVTY